MKLKLLGKYRRILVISDMHIPYHHEDAIAFLKALKKKYKPDLIICLGDLLDFHAISFHDSDPDLYSAGHELKKARKYIKQLEKIFPEMVVIGSNHGDLPIRKLFKSGLPKEFIKSYNEIYKVGKGWKFVDDCTVDNKYYFVHGMSAKGINLALARGLCVIQGHYHTIFNITYMKTFFKTLWSMQAGCLIDNESYAFAYNKLNIIDPVIGTGLIIDGQPVLAPMKTNKKGRWVGHL